MLNGFWMQLSDKKVYSLSLSYSHSFQSQSQFANSIYQKSHALIEYSKHGFFGNDAKDESVVFSGSLFGISRHQLLGIKVTTGIIISSSEIPPC